MQCLEGLPAGLLGVQDGVESGCDLSDLMPGASFELQAALQAACSADVRPTLHLFRIATT